ncbi:DUF2304 family protein [Pyxidicoccus sp. 3LG]
MIRIFLTFMLAIVALYAVRGWRVSRIVSFMSLAASIVGLVLVWLTEVATRLAAFFGVGRGADLVFYVYITISFLMILNLSLKLRIQHETMTRLVRHLALRDARQPLSEER